MILAQSASRLSQLGPEDIRTLAKQQDMEDMEDCESNVSEMFPPADAKKSMKEMFETEELPEYF